MPQVDLTRGIKGLIVGGLDVRPVHRPLTRPGLRESKAAGDYPPNRVASYDSDAIRLVLRHVECAVERSLSCGEVEYLRNGGENATENLRAKRFLPWEGCACSKHKRAFVGISAHLVG